MPNELQGVKDLAPSGALAVGIAHAHRFFASPLPSPDFHRRLAWRMGPMKLTSNAMRNESSCLPPKAPMPVPVPFNPGGPPAGQAGRSAWTARPHRRSAARQDRPQGMADRMNRPTGLLPGTRATRRHRSGQTVPAMSA